MPNDPDTAPSLALDDQLCFALYAASRAVTARYRPLLEALGLTYPQYLVMLLLWSDGPLTVGYLGQRLQLDSGTLSPLLKRLESAGLVHRRRLPSDERSVQVALTQTGDRLRDAARCIPAAMGAAMGLDEDERAALVVTLATLGDSVSQNHWLPTT